MDSAAAVRPQRRAQRARVVAEFGHDDGDSGTVVAAEGELVEPALSAEAEQCAP